MTRLFPETKHSNLISVSEVTGVWKNLKKILLKIFKNFREFLTIIQQEQKIVSDVKIIPAKRLKNKEIRHLQFPLSFFYSSEKFNYNFL